MAVYPGVRRTRRNRCTAGVKILPAVGKYTVCYRSKGDGRSWTVGGPGTYVDYKGIRYEGDGLERLRAVLEREKIEKMLEWM